MRVFSVKPGEACVMKQSSSQGDVLREALAYQDGLVAYAYGLVRDWSLAEDVVQNAYVVVMEKWQTFEPGTSLFNWVRAIVRFKSLEMLRRRKRERSGNDAVLGRLIEQAMDEYLDEQAAQRQRETMHKLQACMQKITERSLELVLERYSMRRSYRELSALFNMSVEAVRKSLYRIRRTLQECVESMPDLELVSE